ncbi:hypothetical protein D1007_36518 [Hordeum vulgare]|uniref:Predicted protein n=1 Tax=Hordeum vulgare subsp. vulgare TaxID=112509 RepID=F2DSR8_HORVV|nr:uncharacterized protein LOC123447995 [Hordeum vulgare subsp. vulgare]KAE8789270.1 hypothetical protein D1007_36518 [Hordeum vulgare]KAI4997384.1 hypothetical protein ZWY2020_052726 [Hordeum vulgare]BAJ98139.1 predicted protein [Hordeum vulgare subsp. vulgare]
MESSNLPTGNMMQGTPYGSLNVHGNSMQMHASSSGKQLFNQSQMLGSFAMPINRATEPHNHGFQFGEHEKRDHHHHHQHSHHSKNSISDEEEHDMTEDVTDTQNGKGKKGSAWHRMKWTGSMVKLLITAASYTGEDPGADLGGRRNITIVQKKGKWKAISKVMGERGCSVSPQQCEDKFNDLNKRYKRLTDILGRGTACCVVENPALLDSMHNLSDKMKEDARKILNSKHLFYEQMCSYHNNNRVNLPEDPALQHSLQVALRCKEEHDLRRDTSGDLEEDEQSADSDYEEHDEERQTVHTNLRDSSMNKRMCHAVDHGDVGFVTSSSNGVSGRFDPHGITLDMNNAFPGGANLSFVQKDLTSQLVELQKHRLQIQEQKLEVTKQRLKWERFRMKKDREIERLALENEQKMFQHKHLEIQLRDKELELELKGNANHA